MSWRHYNQGLAIARGDAIEEEVDFYSIIVAAMYRADTINLAMLKESWPKVWEEFRDRHSAPGGWLSLEEAVVFSNLGDDELSTINFLLRGWPYG